MIKQNLLRQLGFTTITSANLIHISGQGKTLKSGRPVLTLDIVEFSAMGVVDIVALFV